MTTEVEYDYALLRRIADHGFDSGHELPRSARFRDRFTDMHRKGWIHPKTSSSVLTTAGRNALALMDADPRLDHDRIGRSLDIENRIEEHVAVIDPWLDTAFAPAEPGTAAAMVVRRGRDLFGVHVSYHLETVEEAEEIMEGTEIYVDFFMPLAVDQVRRAGVDILKFVGLIARPKGDTHRYPRLAEERFHALLHPVHGVWLRAPSLRALTKIAADYEPPPAPIEEPSELTAAEIEQDGRDAPAYAYGF
ncbi:hypothetical protein [Aureimonas sp. SK2]|uniref:hypothetical protein n=1 Tax=Aureimonas sp. SK2 TaxID=3015992 RepID=UPI00244398FE|nr:hypothetical protein [Aureimonas sp. SK2]